MTDADVHQIRRGPNAVADALAAAHAFCARAGIAACAPLAVIVEELVLNLLDHQPAGGDDAIELALERDGDRIRLSLSDGGPSFDPRGAPAPGVPPARGGGAGLALVRAWSRIERYTRIGARNHLVLLIPIEPAPPLAEAPRTS